MCDPADTELGMPERRVAVPRTSQSHAFNTNFCHSLQHCFIDFIVDKNADCLRTSCQASGFLSQSDVQVLQFETMKCIGCLK